jgi:hypothetical protein
MNVVCLIADLVRSRDIEDRRNFQNELKRQLDELNATSSKHLLSPYTITLGDEFQAVYKDFMPVFTDISQIIWVVYPTRIRFSLSLDILSTDINPNESLGMDGPAFYSARAQLNELKSYEKTIIAVSTKENKNARLINKGLVMFSNEYETWNRTAVGCFISLMRDKNIKDMENIVNVKERMVYKAIANNHIKDYVDFLKLIPEFLDENAK